MHSVLLHYSIRHISIDCPCCTALHSQKGCVNIQHTFCVTAFVLLSALLCYRYTINLLQRETISRQRPC
uniref:Uncharacterized protein n=1 Tax=Anguilla anguilla TaxID=7936 RepID=A0A0E9WD67_ANGAN